MSFVALSVVVVIMCLEKPGDCRLLDSRRIYRFVTGKDDEMLLLALRPVVLNPPNVVTL